MKNDSQAMQDQVRKVFREVFEDSELLVTDQTLAVDIPNWDSLTHISLIIGLEGEFGIEFSTEEVISMTSVGDLFAVLQNKGVGHGSTG